MNYFDFFLLPTEYEISTELLEKKYIFIQQSSHPDKLSNKTADKRYKALNHSIEANNAYAVLKDPLLRAKHLLSLRDINIDQEIRVNTPTTLLQQTFIDREKLEETDSIDELNSFLSQAKNDTQKIEMQLAKAFRGHNLENIVLQTIKLQYKTKLISEIKNKIKKIR